ncbi:L-idonate 5-dehydrogenase [Mameliella sp. CS4]|uniref:L-idonate 5-dehydrogenase n=1 Tax=Mameliella sp. CS4 TaxID=2862329 RepID=UPI001C5D3D81|nr:L-idonate 5-dehydrogenase [Mameliella sp. CS4]MBW4983805.1 L-idonate 5-dehydrogenase [Mameliella sp. CS4]
MKTIVAHGAHDLRIEDREMPVPGPGQVLVRLETGGICGSDLHYYHKGGFGTVRLKEPMILGHEVAGQIEALGAGVSGLAEGLRVAVSPSRPCHACRFCHAGQPNHCLNMRFYGSAMPFPHIQGAFREYLVADVAQCAPAGELSAGEAAMAEPLSVVLHAARRAGDLLGKRVLVTGCGPIGMLAVLVARAAGAVEIVATDLTDFTLDMAARLGADRVVNMGKHPEGLAPLAAEKGQIDVLFECSGAAPALVSAIPTMRPGGVILQLGLGGDMTLPVQAITAKELELRGSFRFHEEFFAAVELMRKGRIDVKPLITHEVTLEKAEEGFKLASDRSKAMKAQIRFS